ASFPLEYPPFSSLGLRAGLSYASHVIDKVAPGHSKMPCRSKGWSSFRTIAYFQEILSGIPFMVTIRLARAGAKKKPFYYITVADQRNARDGRFIERVGFFNPVARGQEERLRINLERVQYWSGKGAQPSQRVAALVKQAASAPTTEA